MKVFGDLKAARGNSKTASITVSDRIIMLLKGSKSIKENFFDNVELDMKDKFVDNLTDHINLNINHREVPDQLFSVKFTSRSKRAYYKYKQAALICRKNLFALIALDKCIIQASDMEKVLFETQISALNACLDILKRSVQELRATLVPPFFSSNLKKKLIYADVVGEKFWNIPSVVKKEIVESTKREERHFDRGNFNARSSQFFRGQRSGRRSFRSRPFNTRFNSRKRN